jgi:hypothetical protein
VIRTPLVNKYGSRPTSKLGKQPREDIKDDMREAGEVPYAELYGDGSGIVE